MFLSNIDLLKAAVDDDQSYSQFLHENVVTETLIWKIQLFFSEKKSLSTKTKKQLVFWNSLPN